MNHRTNFGADRERLHPKDRVLLHAGLVGLLLLAAVQLFNHHSEPVEHCLDAATSIGQLSDRECK